MAEGYVRASTGTIHWADETCTKAGCVPVVVIDPEDREQVKRLNDEYDRTLMLDSGIEGDDLDCLIAALRSLMEPPKPDEPTGLGAVVEDADGKRWTRTNGRWDSEETEPVAPLSCHWTDVAAVKVLSEGVTA